MSIQMNEPHGIGICDNNLPFNSLVLLLSQKGKPLLFVPRLQNKTIQLSPLFYSYIFISVTGLGTSS
jgi:hypothetical protein